MTRLTVAVWPADGAVSEVLTDEVVPPQHQFYDTDGVTLLSTSVASDAELAVLFAVAPSASVTQAFTRDGTWFPLPGIVNFYVVAIADGSGGGSGRRGAAGTVRCGGGGGAGGGLSHMLFPAVGLPASVPVWVGQGGAGGAAKTTDNGNGNPGFDGSGTALGGTYGPGSADCVLCALNVGGGGSGGTASSGLGGTAVGGMVLGGAGGNAITTGGPGTTVINAAAGGSGGSGGGITSANAPSTGSNGGPGGQVFGLNDGGGAATGAVPFASLAGQVGCGGGGAGGAGSVTVAAGAGQDGATYGGAGAGGGASLNGFNSGAGGRGAPGLLIVVSYF